MYIYIYIQDLPSGPVPYSTIFQHCSSLFVSLAFSNTWWAPQCSGVVSHWPAHWHHHLSWHAICCGMDLARPSLGSTGGALGRRVGNLFYTNCSTNNKMRSFMFAILWCSLCIKSHMGNCKAYAANHQQESDEMQVRFFTCISQHEITVYPWKARRKHCFKKVPCLPLLSLEFGSCPGGHVFARRLCLHPLLVWCGLNIFFGLADVWVHSLRGFSSSLHEQFLTGSEEIANDVQKKPSLLGWNWTIVCDHPF